MALGSEFRVNSYTTSHQTFASVASDADGDFVVIWQSFGQDGSGLGIFGQRYDSDGAPRGGEFRANTEMADDQFLASLASDAAGNLLVTWTSDSPAPGRNLDVRGQRFDSTGIPLEGEFKVNSYTPEYQGLPNVGALGLNQFVVAWGSVTQDGSGYGVFGRSYDFAGGKVTVASPNSNVAWPIGVVEQIRWTHDLGAGRDLPDRAGPEGRRRLRGADRRRCARRRRHERESRGPSRDRRAGRPACASPGRTTSPSPTRAIAHVPHQAGGLTGPTCVRQSSRAEVAERQTRTA